MIYIVALGVGLKWPLKIHLNTQRTVIFVPPPTVCSNGLYADISNQHQVQQYKIMFAVISIIFCNFEVP